MFGTVPGDFDKGGETRRDTCLWSGYCSACWALVTSGLGFSFSARKWSSWRGERENMCGAENAHLSKLREKEVSSDAWLSTPFFNGKQKNLEIFILKWQSTGQSVKYSPLPLKERCNFTGFSTLSPFYFLKLDISTGLLVYFPIL